MKSHDMICMGCMELELTQSGFLERTLFNKYTSGYQHTYAAMKKEFLSEMQSKVKVSDRLSDYPKDSSYINNMSLTRARVWIRTRARAIAGVKGNFRHSHVNDMACRFWGLDLSDKRGLLDFWRRMKMKLAPVT